MHFYDLSVEPLNQIAVVYVLVFLPIIQREELMGWHLSGFARTRIRVIRVNFSKI